MNDVMKDLLKQAFEGFKAEGKEAESVLIVVLFKSDNDQRSFQISHAISDDGGHTGPEELFCESAGRLNEEAYEIATKARS